MKVSQNDSLIHHKSNRVRVTLKNELTFDGQTSGDKIQRNGNSEKCFEPNANYKSLFLNSVCTPS